MITKAVNVMDTFELKREQLKLAVKVELRDDCTTIKTIGGAECLAYGSKLLASVVVCEFPSLKVLEHKTYFLSDALPYQPGFTAYREMPALIEAYNQLEQEPDIFMVKGEGILHPRRIGLASHLGLALNKATFGIQENLFIGTVEQGKIFLNNELVGFEVMTREHAKSLYISPGHLVSLGSILRLTKETLRFPHKMPEPLHLAHKLGKRILKEKILSIKHQNTNTQKSEVLNLNEVQNHKFQTEKEEIEIKEDVPTSLEKIQEIGEAK